MTLLLDHAIGEFSFTEASLITPSKTALDQNTSGQKTPVAVIGGNAAEREELHHPDHEEWIRIPLHGRDTAEITSDYIIYTEHNLRGKLFIYSDANGDTAHISAEEFCATPLARRVRYWHADYVPSSSPSYYSSPLNSHEAARNPLSNDPDEFFTGLIDFIDSEQAAQRNENVERALCNSPSKIYSEGGDAIPSLTSHGHIKGNICRFKITTDGKGNPSLDDLPRRYIQSTFGIYEGNDVVLVSPSPETAPDTFPLFATVSDITRENIYLECDREAINDRTVRSYLRNKSQGYGLVGVLNPVPFNRERNAVDSLRADSSFGDVLTGAVPLTFTDSTAAQSQQCDPHLNQDQERAVEHALAADRLFCIHGPPGTGKTRTLVEIIRRAARVGQDILVCADSNRAVDNIVAGSSTATNPDEHSLHAHAQHEGGEFTLHRNNAGRSSNELVQNSYATVSNRADVVASTNGSAATLDRTFDVVVIDEATQATITSTCIPLARADRAVLAGDHRQLPPYSATEELPDESVSAGSGISLFEHLYSDSGVYEGVGIPLRTQYRMHRNIVRFPNRRFYDDILESGRSITAVPEYPALVGYDIGGSESVSNASTANATEARLIAHLVTNHLNTDGITADDIGVITPYTAQKQKIENALSEDGTGAVTVDTIDAFQGSEKTIILISLVRSNAEGRVGFLGRLEDGPRRLNVALTRAKRFCGIVGDWRTLTRDRKDGGEKCTELYRSLRSHLDDTGRFRHVEPEFLPSI